METVLRISAGSNQPHDTEKRVYLQNSIKDIAARHTIKGLTKSSEHYGEAVKRLKARYDHLRLIHKTYVPKIVEAPGLKEGSGKEQCILHVHDNMVQHLSQ